jgi:3D (Asp-Asp-Asp) domain-containing protein
VRRGFWYHGKYFVPWEHLRLVVTSYAPDRFCCWPYPGTTTASGKSVWTNDGHLVAADTNLIPFGMMVRVPGYDHDRPVPVLDRGGAIQGYRLDVLSPTLWQAQHWGRKLLMVEIYRPVAGH